MKILQIVTYASTDGAFGGPLAVAIAQSSELAKRGHQVELIAGWDGKFQLTIPGVKVTLFEVTQTLPLGFSGMTSRALVQHVADASESVDLVHVHLGRDLITAPSASAVHQKAVLVLQTHGMVMPDRRVKSRIFDQVWTRKILRRASTVFHLTSAEESGLREIEPSIHTAKIHNGVTSPQITKYDSPSAPEVLFLSRLHPRKRVLDFAVAAEIVLKQQPDARVSIVGADEGDLSSLQEFIRERGLEANVRYEGSVEPGQSQHRMSRATVYVLPSVGEVVPMSVLEALSVGVPSIVTNENGLADALLSSGAGIVTAPDPKDLAEAILGLLENEEARRLMSVNARRLIDDIYSAPAVAADLERIYADLL